MVTWFCGQLKEKKYVFHNCVIVTVVISKSKFLINIFLGNQSFKRFLDRWCMYLWRVEQNFSDQNLNICYGSRKGSLAINILLLSFWFFFSSLPPLPFLISHTVAGFGFQPCCSIFLYVFESVSVARASQVLCEVS